MTVRIIPRLDIKGGSLVKGIHLEGLRVLGRPEKFARHYYEQGADELLYVDVVASLFGRNHLLDVIERTAREIFIPLTVAGGLRTLEDIQQVLRAGADKVALNTAALAEPELVRRAAHRFGSSAIVVSIEAVRLPDGRYEAYVDNGREATGTDAIEWAQRATVLCAGEILVTSGDREGTGRGFDLDLVRRVAQTVPRPVVAGGGAGSIDDVRAAVESGGADAVAVASLFHYRTVRELPCEADELDAVGNVDFLRCPEKRANGFARVRDATIAETKRHLQAHGIACRPVHPRHAREATRNV